MLMSILMNFYLPVKMANKEWEDFKVCFYCIIILVYVCIMTRNCKNLFVVFIE